MSDTLTDTNTVGRENERESARTEDKDGKGRVRNKKQ